MMSDLDMLIARYRTDRIVEGLPYRHFIGGERVASQNGAMMESFDPGSGRAFHAFAAGNGADVDLAVEAAAKALHGEWGRMLPASRGAVLARAAALIRENSLRLAFAECLDSGKPLPRIGYAASLQRR